MFHDTKLHQNPMADLARDQLAWVLNPYAFKLYGMLEYYRKKGQTMLPVAYLKRAGGFTRRQWELATKGNREYSDRKLVQKMPASDGLEHYGIINEVTLTGDHTPATYFVLGEVTSEVVQELSDNLHDKLEGGRDRSDNEDAAPGDPGEATSQPATSTDAPQLSAEFDHGFACGYDRGFREGGQENAANLARCIEKDPATVIAAIYQKAVQARCVIDTSINNKLKGALLTQPGV